MSFLRRTVRFGSPRNLRANSAGSTSAPRNRSCLHWTGCGAPQRDRWTRRFRLGHRRRAERDRPGRPATRRGKAEQPTSQDRRNANLNTAAFDRQGVLWFTGQNGVYGRVDPKTGAIAVFNALRGTGPYRIATPDGQVFFASLAGNYLDQIDVETALSSRWSRPCRAKARGTFAPTAAVNCGSRGWNSGDLFPPRQRGQELGALALTGRWPAPLCRLRRRERCGVGQRLGSTC